MKTLNSIWTIVVVGLPLIKALDDFYFRAGFAKYSYAQAFIPLWITLSIWVLIFLLGFFYYLFSFSKSNTKFRYLSRILNQLNKNKP